MRPRATTVSLRAKDAGDVASSDATGRATAFVPVPIPASVQSGVYRVSLSMPIRFPNDAFYLIAIPPAGDRGGNDAHLVRLRKEYVGRLVQAFGVSSIACSNAESRDISKEFAVENEASLRVAAIDRRDASASAGRLRIGETRVASEAPR